MMDLFKRASADAQRLEVLRSALAPARLRIMRTTADVYSRDRDPRDAAQCATDLVRAVV